ncbi:neugrin [Holotrichia oblita]|uniref:Neugrin n=1 Tax=Holotrichia oblita TaxID=644536 RepID=A0ACB9SXB7_HOLOL|nr:neugrin [Holotrichia oblita]
MFKQIGGYLLDVKYASCLKAVVRYKRNRSQQLFRKRTTANPGIQSRAKLLEDKLSGSEDIPDIADLDSLESDFMQAGNVYNEHTEQLAKLKDQEKFLIVKQKYFKETYPNFLTWNDKEQIRYLHKTNPDEWTIEKLSDGFPALPGTIKKIIKASWTKTNSTKIINHDNSVKKNWEMFKREQLNLPLVLTNHLQKFTSRNYNQSRVNTILPSIETKPKVRKATGEFSEIIRSYERLKTKQAVDEEENTQPNLDSSSKRHGKEMYLLSSVTQNNHTTLESLKTSLRANVSLGEEVAEDDKILLKSGNDTAISSNEIPENSIIDLKDISKTAYLSTSPKSVKDEKHLIYPEKITIPKDKLRVGCTYKLYDCYYDSDGIFLYRVPGMEK